VQNSIVTLRRRCRIAEAVRGLVEAQTVSVAASAGSRRAP
jgi:hypothetical protein